MTPAEFDRFSDSYEATLDRAVAWSGHSAAHFAEHKARYVARLAPGFSGKLLDFGCGVGVVTRALAARLPHAEIHGYDPSAASLARVDPALRARGRFTDRLEDLDRDYGLILAVNVLHHVDPEERPAVVRDLAARLAPGGQLVVLEHNPKNPLTRRLVRDCPFDEGVVLLPAKETTGLLRAAGLADVRRDYVVFFPRFLSALDRLEPALANVPLGAQHVTRGRRPAAEAPA